MQFLKKVALGALTCFTATAFSLSAQAESTIDKILKTGKLTIAVQTSGPPVSFVNKEGKRTGLAVELARAFADDMGVELVIQDYDWKGLIPALKAGKADMIAADMTPTPKRHLQVLFSEPVFYAENIAFSTKGKKFGSWKDLNNDNVTMAGAHGTTMSEIIKKHLPDAKLKEFAGGVAQTVPAVLAGRADAGVSDRANISQYLQEYDELVVLDGSITKVPLGFATRPDSVHLMFAINNYLRLITHDGRREKLIDYWWNSTAWQADHK